MHLKRLILFVALILALTSAGFAQEKVSQAKGKADPPKELKETKQNASNDQIKSVPITNKNMEAMRLQNRKVTTGQMHTINKAMRKSMTIRRRR